MSRQSVYGFPCVTNPHDFDPDRECCSPAEIEAHRLAKANWGKPSFVLNQGCYSTSARAAGPNTNGNTTKVVSDGHTER